MLKNTYFFLVLIGLLGFISCKESLNKHQNIALNIVKNGIKIKKPSIEVGANQLKDYLSLLKNKKVGFYIS